MGNSFSALAALPAGEAANDAHAQMIRTKMKWEIGMTLVGLGASLFFSYYALKLLLSKMDPTGEEKKRSAQLAADLLKHIGVDPDIKLSDYELCIASNLTDTNDIDTRWEDIGGLSSIIDEIKENVILPFTRSELFTSELLQPPKGVLLYGPPGCGKTMIAKATAKASGARFINLQASSLFDKWYGESQKRAEAIFSLAVKLQPTIIFIDEIDAFLRSRGSTDHESTAMIKAQFMTLWDGLATDVNAKVLIMGATNRPLDVDPAIRRRMPCTLQITKPKVNERAEILRVLLRGEPVANRESVVAELSRKTDGLSGSDLKELCRHAAIIRVREYLANEDENTCNREPILRPMTLADFLTALDRFHTMSIQMNMPFTTNLHDGVDD